MAAEGTTTTVAVGDGGSVMDVGPGVTADVWLGGGGLATGGLTGDVWLGA